MKNKEYYFIHSIYLLILFLTINILIFSPKDQNHDTYTTNIELDTNTETTTLPNDVAITNTITYQAQNLTYGSKDNHPYILITNNQTKATNEIIFNDQKGIITNLKYNGIYFTTTIKNDTLSSTQDYFLSNNTPIPFNKKQLTFNYSTNTTITPQYLVIHETANTKAGANASSHYRYWSTNKDANTSAHFVVDSNEIYQMLELNQMAWHVGDNKGYSNIKNTNSIGIELCVNSDGNYMQARQYTIDLTIAIMKTFNMNINQLKKHQDASGKYDPIIMLNNNLWDDFVNQVNIGLNK